MVCLQVNIKNKEMTFSKTQKIKQRIFGPVIEDSCDACGKPSVWLLAKSSEDYSVFGTALFSLKTEYSLMCMLCGYGIGLHKSLFEKLKPIAEKNAPAKEANLTTSHS